MQDWLSYRISDFLMYSPDIYYRLLGRYNAALWPVHYLAFAITLVALWLMWKPRRHSGLLVGLVAASGWGFTGEVFFQHYYATISWAAPYFAYGFMAQAVLLVFAGARGWLHFEAAPRAIRFAGFLLFTAVLLGMPMLAMVEGRALGQDEIVWLTPDATVLATFAAFITAARCHGLLYIIPLCWATLNGALLWAMESESWWLMPVMALAAVLTGLYRRYLPPH
jgi:hypothetical protein